VKALLVCEFREGKLQDGIYEAIAFAGRLGAGRSMLLIGRETELPRFDGKLLFADVAEAGEYHPALHRDLVAEAARREQADVVVLLHTSYGWDLAPRVAAALGATQVSEVVGLADGGYEVPACTSKMRRVVKPRTPVTVVTLQAGAFPAGAERGGVPCLERLAVPAAGSAPLVGYEASGPRPVDLGRAEVIVSAGRGVGKKEHLPVVAALARALGGELGASRPVVDAGWLDHGRQVGTTGQTVAPRLYVACGISGAVQHLAGMKRAEFVVAINKDREAPIGEVADVLVVGDLHQIVPAVTARLEETR
jgi:electron transfer flavoprotein alpha subunit